MRYRELLAEAKREFDEWDRRNRPARYAEPAPCICGCGKPRWNRTVWARACYYRRYRAARPAYVAQDLEKARERKRRYRQRIKNLKEAA